MAGLGKVYRRAVKRAGVRKIGRRVYKATGLVNPVKKGKVSSTRLMKDVAMLKRVINSEKKEITSAVTSVAVGQINVNANTAFIEQDITPIMSQGITGQTRNGISIKPCSMIIRGQLIQQSGALQGQKIIVEVFMNKSTTISGSLVAQLYDTNPLTGLYDYNAPRAMDTFKNWVKIASRRFTIGQDNLSGVVGFTDVKLPIRFKGYHVKFDSNNTNAVTSGQLVMVVRADSGNIGGSASTNTFIPVTAAGTGSNLNYFIKTWFYDN